MATMPKHHKQIIENIWTLLALVATDYWSSEALARAEGLFWQYVHEPANAAQVRALMEETRKKAADELGIPPWSP